jgi:hypothetical protein
LVRKSSLPRKAATIAKTGRKRFERNCPYYYGRFLDTRSNGRGSVFKKLLYALNRGRNQQDKVFIQVNQLLTHLNIFLKGKRMSFIPTAEVPFSDFTEFFTETAKDLVTELGSTVSDTVPA